MKLYCYGKYGPYPKAGCACSCYLLVSKGKNIIIDLGCGGLSKIFNDLGAQDFDAVVLSHLHADHMADMLTLRYALDASRKLGRRDKPLRVYMPDKPAAEAKLIAQHGMMDVKIISDGCSFNICGTEARFALMPHAVPSYAVAFRAEGKTFVYSGDTADNGTLAPFAKDADLFLMEAAFLSAHKPEGAAHVSAVEAGRIAMEAGAKRLLLTHIFPEYDEYELLSEACRNYPGAEVIKEKSIYEV